MIFDPFIATIFDPAVAMIFDPAVINKFDPAVIKNIRPPPSSKTFDLRVKILRPLRSQRLRRVFDTLRPLGANASTTFLTGKAA
jgi:hypothetical protein